MFLRENIDFLCTGSAGSSGEKDALRMQRKLSMSDLPSHAMRTLTAIPLSICEFEVLEPVLGKLRYSLSTKERKRKRCKRLVK